MLAGRRFVFLIVGCTGLCCDLQAFSVLGHGASSDYDTQAVVCVSSVVAGHGP